MPTVFLPSLGPPLQQFQCLLLSLHTFCSNTWPLHDQSPSNKKINALNKWLRPHSVRANFLIPFSTKVLYFLRNFTFIMTTHIDIHDSHTVCLMKHLSTFLGDHLFTCVIYINYYY